MHEAPPDTAAPEAPAETLAPVPDPTTPATAPESSTAAGLSATDPQTASLPETDTQGEDSDDETYLAAFRVLDRSTAASTPPPDA